MWQKDAGANKDYTILAIMLLFETAFSSSNCFFKRRVLSTQWTFHLNNSQATAIAFNDGVR